jgi:ribosomal protein L18
LSANKTLEKPSGESRDPFAFFKQATSEIFEFLITDFGFSYVNTVVYAPDCVIEYRNETTGITVRYEWTSQISVSLIKLKRESNKVLVDKRYSLLLLLEIRRPRTDPELFSGTDKEWTNEFVEKLLREYASALKEEAWDILTGDFRIFAELRKRRGYYRRQQNKEDFGTYNGESPRFSSRPTLEEIFADVVRVNEKGDRLSVGNPDRWGTIFRIYEAHWDHQYSVGEIADFLNRSAEEIKQDLDEQDDLV